MAVKLCSGVLRGENMVAFLIFKLSDVEKLDGWAGMQKGSVSYKGHVPRDVARFLTRSIPSMCQINDIPMFAP